MLKVNTAAACGILANLYDESRFNPKAVFIEADGRVSYGICQWNAGRLSALYEYCEKRGYDYTSLSGQLQYLQYELNERERAAFYRVKSVSDTANGAYEAGYNWARYFERCAERFYAGRAENAYSTYWAKYGNANEHFVLSIIGETFPSGELPAGSGVELRGILRSDVNITHIQASVTDADGHLILNHEQSWNSPRYNIATDGLNNAMSFASLGGGHYTYTLTAADASGTEKILVQSSFTVNGPVSPYVSPDETLSADTETVESAESVQTEPAESVELAPETETIIDTVPEESPVLPEPVTESVETALPQPSPELPAEMQSTESQDVFSPENAQPAETLPVISDIPPEPEDESVVPDENADMELPDEISGFSGESNTPDEISGTSENSETSVQSPADIPPQPDSDIIPDSFPQDSPSPVEPAETSPAYPFEPEDEPVTQPEPFIISSGESLDELPDSVIETEPETDSESVSPLPETQPFEPEDEFSEPFNPDSELSVQSSDEPVETSSVPFTEPEDEPFVNPAPDTENDFSSIPFEPEDEM